MQSALYVSLSAQVAMEKRLASVANNVANMNTGGFRAEEIKFEEILSTVGRSNVAFASTGENFISRRQGEVKQTGNALDIAIQGEAFFAVSGPGGTAYTRDGRMKMTENGDLQTLEGYAVLDAGGTPMVLDPRGLPPVIGRDGMMTQGPNQVGQIGVYYIPNEAKLSRFGNSAVRTDRPATPIQAFTSIGVLQGYVEGSNVNPIMEMTRMIALQRTFEGASAAIQDTEDTLMSAIRALGPSS